MATNVPVIKRKSQGLSPIATPDTSAAFGQPQAQAAFESGTATRQLAKEAETAGDRMAQTRRRMLSREDVLATVSEMNRVNQEIEEIITADSAASDFTNSDNVAATQKKIDEVIERARAGFTAKIPENTVAFQADLESVRGKTSMQLRKMHVDAGRKAMDQAAQGKIRELSNTLGAATDPEVVSAVYAEWAAWVGGTYGKTMDSHDESATYQVGMQSFMKHQLDTALMTDDTDEARRLLASSHGTKYVDPEISRGYLLRIARAEGEKGEKVREANAKIQMLKDADIDLSTGWGKQVTASAILGFSAPSTNKTSKPTLAEKVAEATEIKRAVTKDPNASLTADETAKIGKYYVKIESESIWGNTPDQKYAKFLTENSAEFEGGQMTREQADAYLAQTLLLGTFRDPVTKARRPIPPDVRNALHAHGISVKTLLETGGTAGEGDPLVAMATIRRQLDTAFGSRDDGVIPAGDFTFTDPDTEAAVDALDAEQNPASPAAAAPEADPDQDDPAAADRPALGSEATPDEQAASEIVGLLAPASAAYEEVEVDEHGFAKDHMQALQVLTGRNINLYEMAGDIRGVTAGLKDFISSVPWLGKMFRFPEVSNARNIVKMVPPILADLLKRSDREGAVGELRDLQKKFTNLEAAFIAEPEKMRTELRGIDNGIAFEQRHLIETLKRSGNIDDKARKMMMNKLAKIRMARGLLGVRIITTPATTPEQFSEEFWYRGRKVGDIIMEAVPGQEGVFDPRPILVEPPRPKEGVE